MPSTDDTTTSMDSRLGDRLDISSEDDIPGHLNGTASQVGIETASTASTSRSSSPSTASTTSSVETVIDGDVSDFEPLQISEAGDGFDQDWKEWESEETIMQPEQDTLLYKESAAEAQPEVVDNSNVDLENATASTQEASDSSATEKKPEKPKDDSSLQPQQAVVCSHEAGPSVSTTTDQEGAEGGDHWRAAVRKIKWGRHVIDLTSEVCEVAGLETTETDIKNMGSQEATLMAPTDDAEVEAGLIWSNEYFAVKKSPLGGLGAFAVKDLKEGDIILVEKALVRTDRPGLYSAVQSLDSDDKLLFASLAQFPEGDDTGIELTRRIQNANAFEVPEGIAIFSIASRFNHACEPVRNVLYSHEKLEGKKVIVLSVVVPKIPKGTELTIKYGSNAAVLMKNFGFRCRCGGCPEPLSDREAEAISKKWGWVSQNWDW